MSCFAVACNKLIENIRKWVRFVAVAKNIKTACLLAVRVGAAGRKKKDGVAEVPDCSARSKRESMDRMYVL